MRYNHDSLCFDPGLPNSSIMDERKRQMRTYSLISGWKGTKCITRHYGAGKRDRNPTIGKCKSYFESNSSQTRTEVVPLCLFSKVRLILLYLRKSKCVCVPYHRG